MPQRWKKLPKHGTLLISTDLHGNLADFQRLRDIFLTQIVKDAGTQWVILGDMVHGPDERVRKVQPELYDYEDESLAIIEGILALQAEYPNHVHYVLGNHDYGHVGGPHTAKFYNDEVEHLETEIGEADVASLKRLFENALLAVVAPCGALLTHGSPHDGLKTLDDLNRIAFPPTDAYLVGLMETFLTSYGQRGEVTARLLETVSRDCGHSITMVIHGHDREPDGYFVEGDNQLCPVIFGAPRENKRYVQLDLAAHYGSVDALGENDEIRRLYPD
jgi:predicted phosphodiesterase